MTSDSTIRTETKYYTVSEWCKTHSWPPEGGLRHLIFHSDTNGFSRVIRRCGRRVLINGDEFIRYIEERHGNNPQNTNIVGDRKSA